MDDGSVIKVRGPDRGFPAVGEDYHVGGFFLDLAHELGNVAFPLRMIVELQARGEDVASEELQRTLENQITVLQTITRRLQTTGRCLRPELNPSHERLLASDVVAAAADAQRDTADLYGHTLIVDAGAVDFHVFGYSELLIKALAELVNNAVSYTPAGGKIEVSLRAHGPNVEFIVNDNGPGMPTKLLPQIFEPFVIGRERVQIGAGRLGCGLTVVRQVATLHHGNVEVRRTSPEGTEIVLSIPQVDAAQ